MILAPRSLWWIAWLLPPLLVFGVTPTLAETPERDAKPVASEPIWVGQTAPPPSATGLPPAPLPPPASEPLVPRQPGRAPELHSKRSASSALSGSAPSALSDLAPLALSDLERIALECNPTLVQARMAVRAAEGNYVQAGLYPNPALGYIADEVGNDGGAGFQGGQVEQELVTRGKLRLGRTIAGYEIAQARSAFEAQRQRVLNDVRAAYYEALVAQKMVEVNEQLVRIGQQGVEAAEKLWAAQEVSRADLLQAQIEAETARLNLVEAQQALQAAWRRLAAVLGRPDLAPAPLAGDLEKDLPTFDWQETLSRLWAQSPELAQARLGVERARWELARQEAMRVPNLTVAAAVKNDTVSHYTVTDLQVNLPIPLFDRNQGRILRAQADLAAAQHEVRRVELSLYGRLADAFEQYATARRRVEVYATTILPYARASLDLVAAGYREGEFGYLNLLTAQRTYFGVSLDYLRSLREFRLRCVELEGLLLRGGLEKVEGPEPSVD